MEGVRVYMRYVASYVLGSSIGRKFFSNVITSILQYLHQNGEWGLANSIWHSVRVDGIRGNDRELSDTVGDWLYTMPEVENDPWSLLQLDVSRENDFHQLWVVDRIMRDGYVWAGRCSGPPLSCFQELREEWRSRKGNQSPEWPRQSIARAQRIRKILQPRG